MSEDDGWREELYEEEGNGLAVSVDQKGNRSGAVSNSSRRKGAIIHSGDGDGLSEHLPSHSLLDSVSGVHQISSNFSMKAVDSFFLGPS